MLKMIAKLLKVLNSETEPGQISMAFCFAMVAGLTPFLSLHNLVVFGLVLVLRVNLSAFILGLLFFTGVAYLLDPLFHRLGLAVLTAGPLEGFWTALYNITLFRLENFSNSLVLGSLLFSIVFFLPLYFLANALIRKYRDHVMKWVEKSRLMQAFKASKLYNVYRTVRGLGGAV